MRMRGMGSQRQWTASELKGLWNGIRGLGIRYRSPSPELEEPRYPGIGPVRQQFVSWQEAVAKKVFTEGNPAAVPAIL
jgi:hypothetical protein